MSSRSSWLKVLWLTSAGAVAGAYGCSDGPGDAPGEQTGKPDDSVESLIGGVRVSSRSLDAVGALGFVYDYGTGGTGSGGIGNTGGTGPVFDGGAPGGQGGAAGGEAGGAGVAGSPAREATSPPYYGGSGGCSPYGCYPGRFTPACTGTLIGPKAVLTSRSCAGYFSGYYPIYPGSSRFVFAVGADANASERHFEIVHVSYPASGDLAVLHLAEGVSGVTPFPLANLNANHVGQKFATLGYGARDNYGTRGERRAGPLTLRGVEGRLYEFAFGSFEEFFAYHVGSPGTGGAGGFTGDGGPPMPAVDAGVGGFAGAGGPSIPPLPGTGGAAGVGGGPAEDGGGWGGSWGGAGGSGPDWYREQLLAQYNGTLLEPSEAYAGGAEGDAQPCHGDDGGPLARNVNGQVRLFGVMSRLPVYSCERGAIYTRFTPELRDFVAQALRWRDPCDGTTRLGHCEGNVAVRCAGYDEGERRAVRFDCSLLAQTCVSPPGSEVTCSD